MTRRQVFEQVLSAVAGVAVAANVPLSWLPEPVRQETASQHMTRVWNLVTKGTGAAHKPHHMWVSQEIMTAWQAETARFQRFGYWAGYDSTDADHAPLFKTAKVFVSKSLKGREISFWSWDVPILLGGCRDAAV